MTEIRYWVADDGTKFDEEWDCIQYERKQKIEEYKEDIKLYRYNLEPIPIEQARPDMLSIIKVNSIMAADCIHEWFTEEGYESPFYGHSLESMVGTWVYGELIDEGDEWIKLEDKIEKLQNLIDLVNR